METKEKQGHQQNPGLEESLKAAETTSVEERLSNTIKDISRININLKIRRIEEIEGIITRREVTATQ